MAGKSLRNTLTDKTRNRDTEVYIQDLDLSPEYRDCRMRGLCSDFWIINEDFSR